MMSGVGSEQLAMNGQSVLQNPRHMRGGSQLNDDPSKILDSQQMSRGGLVDNERPHDYDQSQSAFPPAHVGSSDLKQDPSDVNGYEQQDPEAMLKQM